MINLSMTKKTKPPQKTKSTRIQKLTRAQIYFFTNFKDKKKPNINCPHQIEPFDTNIIRFGDLNQSQRLFFLFTAGIWRLLSLFSQLGIKK
jgi:hypothetical protein